VVGTPRVATAELRLSMTMPMTTATSRAHVLREWRGLWWYRKLQQWPTRFLQSALAQ